MSMRDFFGNLWAGTKRNAPTILTVSSIGLFFNSVIQAAKATPKARDAIEEKKAEEGHEQLTAVQTVQAVWKCYIWSVLSFLGGTTCSVMALKENNKRIAGLVAVAESGRNLMQEFNEYRKFVSERIGEKKEAEIHNQAIQQVVNQNPPPKSLTAERHEVDGVAPKPMCLEIGFQRYGYLDYDDAKEAVNDLNNRINTSVEGYVSLNDFYRHPKVNWSPSKFGEMVGWSLETGPIKIPDKEDLDYAGTPDGWPCWILEFLNPPQYEYMFFRKH